MAISRKELKQDQIRETLVHGAEAVYSHQKGIWMGLGIVLLVGLAIFGWRTWAERQTTAATIALEEGLEIFHARIRAVGEPEDPAEKTYVEEKNKYEGAARKLAKVADEYARTRPGRIARYYAGLSLIRLERFPEAEEQLKKLESGGDAEMAALARFQLAAIYEKTGRGEEAVRLYRALAERPTPLVPKALVLLALADHYRAADPDEAVRLLNQIKSDFPDSPAREEAEKRLEMIPPKS